MDNGFKYTEYQTRDRRKLETGTGMTKGAVPGGGLACVRKGESRREMHMLAERKTKADSTEPYMSSALLGNTAMQMSLAITLLL